MNPSEGTYTNKDTSPWRDNQAAYRLDAINQSINTFLCPSDGNAPGNSHGIGRTNYRCSRGDIWPRNTGNLADNTNSVARGIFSRGDVHPRSFASITDGTSNTLMLSELVTKFNGHATGASSTLPVNAYPIKGAMGIASREPVSLFINPNLCAQQNIGGKIKDPVGGISDFMGPGMRWTDGLAVYTGFMAVLPPNSPSCVPTAPSTSAEDYAFMTPNSFHTGGVNTAMADGSVHFVSESVDAGNPDQNMSMSHAGPSPWGTWGAMGSLNGGESKSSL